MLSCIDRIMESLVPCRIVIEGVVWYATMDGYGYAVHLRQCRKMGTGVFDSRVLELFGVWKL